MPKTVGMTDSAGNELYFARRELDRLSALRDDKGWTAADEYYYLRLSTRAAELLAEVDLRDPAAV